MMLGSPTEKGKSVLHGNGCFTSFSAKLFANWHRGAAQGWLRSAEEAEATSSLSFLRPPPGNTSDW